MASTVLSGTGNVSYTNSTGQNVRVVINYMEGPNPSNSSGDDWTMSWAGVSIQLDKGFIIGRNLAFTNALFTSFISSGAIGNNSYGQSGAAPTEIMLSTGQTFATAANRTSNPMRAYNIVIIPEAG